MAREPGCGGTCRWFFRNITRWLSFFVASGQMTIWFFHFFSGDNIDRLQGICRVSTAGYPELEVTDTNGQTVKVADESAKPFTCLGPSLAWLYPDSERYNEIDTYTTTGNVQKKYGFATSPGKLPCGGAANFDKLRGNWFTSDSCNRVWRQTFTFRPQEFMDLWTPFFFGVVLLLQHLSPDLRTSWISGNWTKMAVYHTMMALWGCFGYGGNLGIIVGFSAVCAAAMQALLGLMHEGFQTPLTVIDLRDVLSFIPGCRKAPNVHEAVAELQEARVSINMKDKEIAALKAQIGGGTASE